MSDTTVEMEKKYRSMLLKRSGVERLIMGSDMAESARTMILASISTPRKKEEKRIKLFLRFYGNDFSQSEREKIINHLKQNK